MTHDLVFLHGHIIDIFPQMTSMAMPGTGTILANSNVPYDDWQTAEWLHDTFGGNIQCLMEDSTIGKMPDAIWNGQYWEFKSPSTINAIDTRIKRAKGQLHAALDRDGIADHECGILINISAIHAPESDILAKIRLVMLRRLGSLNATVMIRDSDRAIAWLKRKETLDSRP